MFIKGKQIATKSISTDRLKFANASSTGDITTFDANGDLVVNSNLNIDGAGDVTVSNNLIVDGDLTVNGNVTTLNTTEMAVEDNMVVLNSNVTGAPAANAGIEVERGTSANVSIFWDELNDKWSFTDGSSTFDIADVAAMNAADASLTTRVAAEEAASAAADASLTTRVAAEEAARAAAITSEEAARSAADSSLALAAANEKAAKDATISALQADVDANEADSDAAEASLTTRVAAEEAARASHVDKAVVDLVNGAPAVLDTLSELAAAMGDDENFAVTVANDIAAAKSELVGTAAAAMDTMGEISGVVSGLQSETDAEMAAEEAARIAADASLALAAANEKAAKDATISTLQADVDQNEADSDAAELSLTTRLSTEEAERSAADSAITADYTVAITNEAAARSAADSSLTARLSTEEVTRADAITQEIADRSSADSSLTALISTRYAQNINITKAAVGTQEKQNSYQHTSEFVYSGADVTSGNFTVKGIRKTADASGTATAAYSQAHMSDAQLKYEDINLVDWDNFSEPQVFINGIRVPDSSYTWTFESHYASAMSNYTGNASSYTQYYLYPHGNLKDIVIDVTALGYSIEATDVISVTYGRFRGSVPSGGGAGYSQGGDGNINPHDETAYCGDPTASNYIAGANVIDNSLCTYSAACAEHTIYLELRDVYGDGGLTAGNLMEDGVQINFKDGSAAHAMAATGSESVEICVKGGSSYTMQIVGDSWAGSESTFGLGTTAGGAEALAIAANGMTNAGTVNVSFDVNGSGGIENVSLS